MATDYATMLDDPSVQFSNFSESDPVSLKLPTMPFNTCQGIYVGVWRTRKQAWTLSAVKAIIDIISHHAGLGLRHIFCGKKATRT